MRYADFTNRLPAAIRPAVLCLCCCLPPRSSTALDIEAGLGVASGHGWRGKTVRDSVVIRGHAVAGHGPWSAGFWSVWDPDPGPGLSAAPWTELAVSGSGELHDALVRAGVSLLRFGDGPETGLENDTVEICLDVTLDTILLPSVSIRWDVAEKRGVYARLGFAHTVEVVRRTAMHLNLMIGVADADYARESFQGDHPAAPAIDDDSLVDLTAAVSAPMEIREGLTLTPRLEYTRLLDADIRAVTELRGRDIDLLGAALTLALAF